ncbi:MAG: hypothetical protein L5655_10875 [Thermosediminibacteraceae bacterium]|nr:hypothetical protein [Thermosediminibacteraceae bacterium]
MIIPVGGLNPLGVSGYLNAVVGMIDRWEEMKLDFDYVVSPTSSGGPQAGILLGLKLLKPEVMALGMGVGDSRKELLKDVADLIKETKKLLGI